MAIRKPGPKSASELATTPSEGAEKAALHTPHPRLTGRAAAIYRAVVQSFPSGHFSPGEEPQISAYARHCERLERIESMIEDHEGDLAEFERLTRMAERESRVSLALARSLRLTQQARRQPVSAGRAVQSEGAPVVDFSTLRGKRNA